MLFRDALLLPSSSGRRGRLRGCPPSNKLVLGFGPFLLLDLAHQGIFEASTCVCHYF
jgi:hypothetical protein